MRRDQKMQKPIVRRFVMLLIIVLASMRSAYANGREPGVRAGDVPVKAVCESEA